MTISNLQKILKDKSHIIIICTLFFVMLGGYKSYTIKTEYIFYYEIHPESSNKNLVKYLTNFYDASTSKYKNTLLVDHYNFSKDSVDYFNKSNYQSILNGSLIIYENLFYVIDDDSQKQISKFNTEFLEKLMQANQLDMQLLKENYRMRTKVLTMLEKKISTGKYDVKDIELFNSTEVQLRSDLIELQKLEKLNPINIMSEKYDYKYLKKFTYLIVSLILGFIFSTLLIASLTKKVNDQCHIECN